MDLVSAIGLISSFVTLEEAGRSWILIIKDKIKRKEIDINNWDSDDPLVQVCLDRFKTDMGDKYKDHIFSKEEIQDIIRGFFEQNRELRIGNEEKKQMTQIIEDILYAYNEYAKSLMSSGERTLHNTLSSDFSKIMDKLGMIEEQPRKENIKKFLRAIEISKEIELENIEELINGEYEIDRSEIIETIQAGREKLVSIQGNAGSGKSVVCKKLLKGKEYVLVTRAENLSTGKKVNELWDCDVEDAILWLENKPLYIFIDAIEFIADCGDNAFPLLQEIYRLADKYSNVYIITSCRTTDSSAFMKINTKYRIKTYEIPDLAKDEIDKVAKSYPIILSLQQNKKYSDLLCVPFYLNLIVLELYKDIVKKEVLNSGINIVDAVHSETSEDYLQDVADGINKIIPEAKCSVGKRLSKKKLNVRYIHDKSFYSDSEVDPHQESMEDYVVQHITVENFKHQSSAAVYNILKELVIKKDIATGKITLVDWSQYGYKADWLFGVVVDGTYYFMTIHPDGSFKIEALKRNFFTMTEYDKYMDYFGLNEENKNDYRGVIGLVKDAEGNINLIKDTNMYSMPDYTAMGDVLKNVASEGRFPGKDVVTWLRLVMDTTDKIKVLAELDIVIPHIDVNAEYTKANVMGLFKGITTKKEVVRYVFENTGIMLYAYLRGEEERREYLSGNIDINYFDYDDTHAKYSVGEIGNGMKYTIERASVVREIQAVEGSKLIFKKVLPLMGVEFVRYGMLTVVPFPFKYLRE